MVLEPRDLSLEQVLSLSGIILQDLVFSPQLNVLAGLFISDEFEFVNSGVEGLQLLSAQELLLFFRQGSKPLNLFSLDLMNVVERLSLTQEHIDMLFILSIFIGDFGASFLSRDQLVFNLFDSLIMLLTDGLELSLVIRFELSSLLLIRICSLCDDFLQLNDKVFAFLKLCLVLFFFR